MNYERIYQYRFKDVDRSKRKASWTIISRFLYEKMNKPEKMLDPAAGLCEFINAVPSKEKWAVDLNDEFISKHIGTDVKKIIGNSLHVELPDNYFDGIFISNFLEHLHTQEEVAHFLEKMHKALRKGGRLAVMGPNFKYVAREYFDFADHTVILSELGVAEHLYGAGFDKIEIIARFLPLSFRNKNAISGDYFVKLYLSIPFVWRFFGKQFLLIAEK